MIVLSIMSVDQRYYFLTGKESIPRKIPWKDSKETLQPMSWEISWNVFTHQICLDYPWVNLMVGRNMRIWIRK
jgi:hypothetical protein